MTESPEAPVPRLVVVGFGYSARAIADRLGARVGDLAATTRTPDKAAALAAAGARPIVFDGTAPSPELGAAIRAASHLVVSAPAEADGDPLLARHADDLAAAPDLGWIGYLSTVGVYGDFGGGWIDEATAPKPPHPRGRRRLEAEAGWLALGAARGVPAAVFRLAGIYGPGRNAFVNLAAGTAHRIVKPGQVFNRIRVDDIAATVVAGLDHGATGLFNVADDEPAPPQEVVTFAAALMGVEPPPEVPFEEAALSPMARSFYGDCKRVRNERIKRELGVALAAPTYREGLTELWTTGRWRG